MFYSVIFSVFSRLKPANNHMHHLLQHKCNQHFATVHWFVFSDLQRIAFLYGSCLMVCPRKQTVFCVRYEQVPANQKVANILMSTAGFYLRYNRDTRISYGIYSFIMYTRIILALRSLDPN